MSRSRIQASRPARGTSGSRSDARSGRSWRASRSGQARGLKRLTSSSNETEADPLLGGVFIGDYIEGTLVRNRYDVGVNANYRKVPFVGGFLNGPDQPVIPVNQQDNYLFVTALN